MSNMYTISARKRSAATISRDEEPQSVTFNGKTYNIPRRMTTTAFENATDSERLRYFTATMNGIKESTEPFSDKFRLAVQQIPNGSSYERIVAARLRPIYDTNTNVIVLEGADTPAGLFTFADATLLTNDGRTIVWGNNNNLTNPQRNQARYLRFTLTVRPNVIARECRVHPGHFTVELLLSLDDDQVHPDLTRDRLRDPLQALQQTRIITNSDPILGVLERRHGAQVSSHDTESFRARYMDYFFSCMLDCYEPMARRGFVGVSQQQDTLQHDLSRCKQVVLDPVTRRPRTRTVWEYCNDFTDRLKLFTGDQYPIDVAMLFKDNLEQNVQTSLDDDDGFVFPPRDANETTAQALVRILAIRDYVHTEERRIANTARQIQLNQAAGARLYTTQPSLYAQAPINATLDLYSNPISAAAPVYAAQAGPSLMYGNDVDPYLAAQASSTLAATIRQPVGHPTLDDTALVNALSPIWNQSASEDQVKGAIDAFQSIAEQAISRANENIIECWGCTNDTRPAIHNDRYHLWTQCPRRSDPACQARAQSIITERFPRSRRNRGEAPGLGYRNPTVQTRTADMQRNWQREGFTSQAQATMIGRVVDPNTTPAERARLLAQLGDSTLGARVNETNPQLPPFPNNPAPPPPPFGNNNGNGAHPPPPSDNNNNNNELPPLSFCAIPLIAEERIPLYQATLTRLEHQVQLTQNLPHITIPIGDKDKCRKQGLATGTLEALLDTGAGLSCGNLNYHRGIAERCPHLVVNFGYLKDYSNAQPFGLGGVLQKNNPNDTVAQNNNTGEIVQKKDIEAIITYCTPFRVNGRQVYITFGLGTEVTTNSIVSWAFIKAMGGSVMSETNVFVSGTIGEAFPITEHRPLLAMSPPIVPSNLPAAFPTAPVHAPNVVAKLHDAQTELIAMVGSVVVEPYVQVSHQDSSASTVPGQ